MPAFDPTRAVRFDLPRGSVIAGTNERHVLLSCAALDDLVLIAGPDAANAVGRSFGSSIGARVAARLGGTMGVSASPMETVIAHLGGELSLTGLGALSVERWGRALVFVIDRPGAADLGFLASILEGALEACSGRATRCTSLGREKTIVRLLVASDTAVERVRGWLDSGVAWSEVLARLQPKEDGA
jgi:pimeloyl-ACP methyl ester carboxylesterase